MINKGRAIKDQRLLVYEAVNLEMMKLKICEMVTDVCVCDIARDVCVIFVIFLKVRFNVRSEMKVNFCRLTSSSTNSERPGPNEFWIHDPFT